MAEKRIRCPYCQKVFLYRPKAVSSEQDKVNIKCPYCKEQLVLKKDMLLSS